MTELLILLAIIAGVSFIAYNWKQFVSKFKKEDLDKRTVITDRSEPYKETEEEIKKRFRK
jgi:hypothetical protein